MFWSAVYVWLVNFLTKTFGEDFRKFFESIFGIAKTLPEPDIIRVGSVQAAPDEIKDAIRKLVVDLVEKALANRPIIKGVVLAIVRNLPDSFIDTIWDSIFAARIAAGELQPLGPPLVAAGSPIAAADLAKCKVECGIAA